MSGRERQRSEWRLWVALIVLVLVAAYLIAFILKNSRTVKIHWVLGTSNSSVIWLIVVNLLIGLVAGVLISHLYRRRRRRGHLVEDRRKPGDSLGDLGRRDEAERKPS